MSFLTVTVDVYFFAFLSYNYTIYPTFLSPLSKIPDPHFTGSCCSSGFYGSEDKPVKPEQSFYNFAKDLARSSELHLVSSA